MSCIDINLNHHIHTKVFLSRSHRSKDNDILAQDTIIIGKKLKEFHKIFLLPFEILKIRCFRLSYYGSCTCIDKVKHDEDNCERDDHDFLEKVSFVFLQHNNKILITFTHMMIFCHDFCTTDLVLLVHSFLSWLC